MTSEVKIQSQLRDIWFKYLFGGEYFLFLSLTLLQKWLSPVISRDAALYLAKALAWHDAGSYEKMLQLQPEQQWIPAFPLFLIKIFIDYGISPEIAGTGISMLMGSTLPLLTYLLAQEIQHDKRISIAASILILFNPSMIKLASEIQRDMMYLIFCGWGIFFALKGFLKKVIWPWIPAGVLSACAILTRYETFEMLPVLVLASLVFILKKELSWKKICQQMLVFTIFLSMTLTGLIYTMRLQNYIFTTYSKYLTQKWRDLVHTVTPIEKK